jgi:hypothetical protein
MGASAKALDEAGERLGIQPLKQVARHRRPPSTRSPPSARASSHFANAAFSNARAFRIGSEPSAHRSKARFAALLEDSSASMPSAGAEPFGVTEERARAA